MGFIQKGPECLDVVLPSNSTYLQWQKSLQHPNTLISNRSVIRIEIPLATDAFSHCKFIIQFNSQNYMKSINI